MHSTLNRKPQTLDAGVLGFKVHGSCMGRANVLFAGSANRNFHGVLRSRSCVGIP